ncbi:MAG: DUF1524 domain-containing protein [Methylacidiphilales bacterium]|nr:DUF1524 domain-containing protein [Candidatus Methylacidiphilales bacterium]
MTENVSLNVNKSSLGKKYIEYLGNKVALDKKTNIKAGDKYFKLKKEKYNLSLESKKIWNPAVQELCYHNKDDWTKEDIIKRTNKIKDTILKFIGTEIKI